MSDNRIMFLSPSGKLEYLIESLLKANDDNSEESFTLIIVSCYFKTNAADKLIENIRNFIKISSIKIYIDRATALNIGKDELEKWIQNTSYFTKVEVYVANQNNLFHAKAYCLICDTQTTGSWVFGSANLTGNGLIADCGNTELLYQTQNLEQIHEFIAQLNNPSLSWISPSEIEKFDHIDDYFKYALVKAGCFVQIQSLTLEEVLSVVYTFTEEAVKKQLIEKGFGKTTSSKNYFNAIKIKEKRRILTLDEKIRNIFLQYNGNYQTDWGRYGISTRYGGYWLPKNVASYLNSNDAEEKLNLDQCKTEILNLLNKHIDEVKSQAQIDWEEFLNSQPPLILEQFNKPPSQQISDNMERLKNNFETLFNRYSRMDVPFDFTEQNLIHIREIYKSFTHESDLNLVSSDNLNSSSLEEINNQKKSKVKPKLLYGYLQSTIEYRNVEIIKKLSRKDFNFKTIKKEEK